MSDGALISDADSLTRRSDGRFDVKCRDGRAEIATVAQVQSGAVCKTPQLATTDPFDPASCSGPPLKTSTAVSFIAPGATYSPKLSQFTITSRARDCSTVTGCGSWRTVAQPGGPTAASNETLTTHACASTYCNPFTYATIGRGEVFIATERGVPRLFLEFSGYSSPYTPGYSINCPFNRAQLIDGCYIERSRNQGFMSSFYMTLGDTVIPRTRAPETNLHATVASHCARITFSGRHTTTDPSVHVELESVALTRF